jgi:uncharacterized protein
MKLEQSFEVAAPLDRVWAALIDVERVAPCLPGAEISGRNDDGSYNGTFRVKIGPTAAAYAGKLEMEKIDETGHTATMQAQGTDRRGQGGAKATILSTVAESAPGTTLVGVITEYHITGRLARFGRGGMIEEISNRLLREFAQNLQAMVATPAEEGAYETFVGIPAAESQASESRTTEPSAEEQPKRRTRRDLAAAADAVAAASQPPAAPELEAGAPEEEAAAQPGEEVIAEEELAAVLPEASEESQPPATEAPAPAAEVPEPPPAPEPEVPAPVPPEPPATPEPPPPPEPPAAPPPPAVEPPPPPAAGPPPPPATEAEPLDGLALGRAVILERIKSNPAPVIALLLALLLLGRRRRRRRR